MSEHATITNSSFSILSGSSLPFLITPPFVDDPVLKSNKKWTVTFATAGPDTRTTQLFINYVDNASLDDQGFSPFAVVTSGFDTALGVNNPTPDDSNGVNQLLYTKKGNEWLLDNYPNITLISKVYFI